MQKQIDFLNFDSYNATQTNNDSFDSTFTLLNKYTNITKIYLKNIEIPIGFANIRTSNNSNIFSFTMNSINYSIQLS